MTTAIATSITRPAVVFKDTTSLSLLDSIKLGNSVVDMRGGSASFFMRPLLSRTPIILGAAARVISPSDSEGNNVAYDWRAEDSTVGGDFAGWWRFTAPSIGVVGAETPEFPILITDHGPGVGTPIGVVVDGIAGFMPITYAALRKDVRYGDRYLQRMADHVKRQTLSGVCVPADQEAQYDPLLIDYLAKATTLRLIPAAREFWSRQHRTISSMQTAEVAVYPDIGRELEKLAEQLERELPEDLRQLQQLVPGISIVRVVPAPLSSLAGVEPVTMEPSLTQSLRTGLIPPWGFG